MRALRATIGVVGELAITLGVLLLLFVVWQLGFVAVVDSRAQTDVVQALEQDFADVPHSGVVATPGATPAPAENPVTGDLFAILRIPRLGGPTWAKPVYEGVGLDVLAKGLGHYPDTQLPGQVGNVAIAGHRAGHGNPLIDIDKIQPGDVMIIETAAGWYVYKAQRYEIVEPTDTAVLAPVPEQPGATPTQQWFTLTSCNPRYGSSHRYIVFSLFDTFYPRAQGLPPALLADPNAVA